MDIENLKYRQIMDNLHKESDNLCEPYEEEQKFFMENEGIFNYEVLNEKVKNLGANTIFTLRNGNRVQVVKSSKTLLITYGKEGKSKFTGSWTMLNDYEEFGKVLQELNDIIGG